MISIRGYYVIIARVTEFIKWCISWEERDGETDGQVGLRYALRPPLGPLRCHHFKRIIGNRMAIIIISRPVVNNFESGIGLILGEPCAGNNVEPSRGCPLHVEDGEEG